MFENVIMSDWARTNSDWKLLNYSQKSDQKVGADLQSKINIFENTNSIMYEFIYQRNSRQIEILWPSDHNIFELAKSTIFTCRKAYPLPVCYLYIKCSLYGSARWCWSTRVFDHYHFGPDDFTINDFERTTKCARTEFGAHGH